VLLPAIVTGHPFSSIYLDAINRLKGSSNGVCGRSEAQGVHHLPKRIISHRSNARSTARAWELTSIQSPRAMPCIMASQTWNVYVGAYTNWSDNNKEISFEDFLRQFAPYRTESELSAWLRKKGFDIAESTKGQTYSRFNFFAGEGFCGPVSHVVNGRFSLSMTPLNFRSCTKTPRDLKSHYLSLPIANCRNL